MQISNQQPLSVSQQQAWDALNDIAVLKAAIPGCESLTETAPQQYELLILAAVGPVKARFKGRLRLSDLQPPAAYRIDFEGQGGAAGHGKGSASVRLEPAPDSGCILHYEATATVGGKIAQIGQRLVDMAAQKMAGEFFQNFNAQLALRHPPALAASAAAPAPDTPSLTRNTSNRTGLWPAIVAWFSRVFSAS